VIRQRTNGLFAPFVKTEARGTLLVSGTLNTAVPCGLRPLASDIFTERHERAARKAGEACHCVFSEDAPLLVGLLFR
jgi:hypothetical protein